MLIAKLYNFVQTKMFNNKNNYLCSEYLKLFNNIQTNELKQLVKESSDETENIPTIFSAEINLL